MIWILAEDQDGTGSTMTTKEAWDKHEHMRKDLDGLPLKVVKEFEAATWDEAQEIKNKHYGW